MVAQGVAIAVLHVNHGLRGSDSDADENFVRALATAQNLPIYVRKEDVAEGNIEQEARKARYRFFEQQIAADVCDLVATGHTLDDQAETVLYRFLRGAGTAGLSGIRPATKTGIIRPLLRLRRDEIRTSLRNRNIQWQEDRSNDKLEFIRNRIRLRLMPELVETLNPSLPEVLANTASWAQAEEDYWEAEVARLAREYFSEADGAVFARTKPFLELPVAVQRRLLRRGIELVRGSLKSIDFRHIEAIRSMMAAREGSGRLQLPDLDVYRSFDWLRFAKIGCDTQLPRDFQTELTIPGRTEIANRKLSIEMELVSTPVYNDEVQALDWERCAGSLRLRNWRPGDQYQPQGRSSAEKIKTFFQESRVPLWERRSWPVIVRKRDAGEDILWSRGFGPAAGFAALPDSRKILIIREVTESKPRSAASILQKRARSSEPGHAGGPGAEVL